MAGALARAAAAVGGAAPGLRTTPGGAGAAAPVLAVSLAPVAVALLLALAARRAASALTLWTKLAALTASWALMLLSRVAPEATLRSIGSCPSAIGCMDACAACTTLALAVTFGSIGPLASMALVALLLGLMGIPVLVPLLVVLRVSLVAGAGGLTKMGTIAIGRPAVVTLLLLLEAVLLLALGVLTLPVVLLVAFLPPGAAGGTVEAVVDAGAGMVAFLDTVVLGPELPVLLLLGVQPKVSAG